MNLILQRNQHDCGIAVLAMVADLNYETAAHFLAGKHEIGGGYKTCVLVETLDELGWLASHRDRCDTDRWPSFVPRYAHFAVIQHTSPHLVAVRPDGVVLDPAGCVEWWWPELRADELPFLVNAPPERVREVWMVERDRGPSL